MHDTHQKLLRALIAMQVAVLEHADEAVGDTRTMLALEECQQEITKRMKLLKKEFN